MLPRPRFLLKWRSRKTAVAEKKTSGKAHGEYPSADETTIVDSRQDSEEDDRCSEDDPEIKCAAILAKLRALIEEAKANIQIIQAKTKPSVDDDGEKDNQDIQKLNTMIDEAKVTIEVLDSKVSNSGKEKRLRLLFDDAQYVISQVMSAPVTPIMERSGSLNIKKAASCTEEGFFLEQSKKDTILDTDEIVLMDASRGERTRESVLEGLIEEVRLLTGLGDTSKQIATEEFAVEEPLENIKSENIVKTITKTNEVDDRNFLVLMADMVEEFGGMLAEDSAKLAEKAPFPQCWY
jgi:hypothetical protein